MTTTYIVLYQHDGPDELWYEWDRFDNDRNAADEALAAAQAAGFTAVVRHEEHPDKKKPQGSVQD